MIKKFLGSVLLFGIIFGLIFAFPSDSFARKHRSSSKSKKSRSTKSTKSTKSSKSRKGKTQTARSRKHRKTTTARRGGLPASAIPPERVTEIQSALKREGYLQSEPNGQYDRATVEAMTNYQREHNFRTTGYPTAESLQKLGLTRQRRVNPPATPGENRQDGNSPGSQTPPHVSDQFN